MPPPLLSHQRDGLVAVYLDRVELDALMELALRNPARPGQGLVDPAPGEPCGVDHDVWVEDPAESPEVLGVEGVDELDDGGRGLGP